MDLTDMTREDLIALLEEQHEFTETLRMLSTGYKAHSGHLIANDCSDDEPLEDLRMLKHLQVELDSLLVEPSPIMRGRAH